MKDRIVLVTGGAAGMGRSVALLAATQGAKVAIVDSDPQGVLAVCTEAVRLSHGTALGVHADVCIEQSVDKVFAQVERDVGVPSAIFCAAGTAAAWNAPAENSSAAALSAEYIARAAIGLMMRHQLPGAIVCATSPESQQRISLLVRSLAVEYARHGIRVNALIPGAVETPALWAHADEAEVPALREQLAREIPVGRLSHPDELARAALWLFSDEASYVTGSHLVCDGGVLARASLGG